MTTISQLNAPQLARHAFNVFLFAGRHQTGARLIYRALELDPHNAEALRCLSDFFDAERTEVFSAVVLEYALAGFVELTADERKELDDLRFLAKWSWQFSRHKSGEPYLPPEAFQDRDAFEVDEARYQKYLGQLVLTAGSLSNAFQAAVTLCGAMGHLLTHKEAGTSADLEEVIHPDRFVRSTTYAEWLLSDTRELDALEIARQKKSMTRK